MCGIAGAVGPIPDRTAAVRAVLGHLHHRGPDDSGEFMDPDCTLAMRRLSIIDIAGGHQPLFNETRDIASICNGELYNFQSLTGQLKSLGHVFSTGSDAEVAVHGYESWGDDVFTKINGMFAIAVWDARRRRLLLARDRMGKKPLYYTRWGSGLVFASELRSLLALPAAAWTVDREACGAFCLFGYLPADRTPIVQIRRLLPGHLAVWDASGWATRVYWEPEPLPPLGSEAQATESLLALVRDAVQLRLISDVPVGAFLSGGLDSSTVVAIAAGELGARIPTYSIAFPGHQYHDEAPYAKRVAQYFGCEHHEIPADPPHFADLDSLVWALDEPVADPAAFPTLLLSREARKEVTVVLTGEGADEVFGGYERYWLALRGAALAGWVKIPERLADAGLRFRGKRADDDSRLSRLLRAAVAGGRSPLAWSRALAMAPATTAISGYAHDEGGVTSRDCSPLLPAGRNRLLALQLDDLGTMLPNGLMTKVDRMTMASSLEARCPFLDYRIVDFGLGLPDAWKIRHRTTKVLLRLLARRLLPRNVYTRPKHTFRVPLSEWLRGPLKRHALDAASSSTLARLGIVAANGVARMAEDHLAGRADFTRGLWAFVTLHLWLTRAAQDFTLEAAQ